MNILVLNGSPKCGRSDVLVMTRAFIEGMNGAEDNSVEYVHVAEKDIGYCTGCFACKHNGGRCVLKDEMGGLLEKMLASELIIYSFGLYSYGMPGALKNFLDRTMPLSSWNMFRDADGKYGHRYQYDVSRMRFMMICGCGYPNSKHNFEGAVRQFELKYPENAGIITVPETPMFNIPQAKPFTEPRLDELRRAGAEFAKEGRLSPETLQRICSPMIPDDIYAKFANGELK